MSRTIPSDDSEILAIVREYITYAQNTQTLLSSILTATTDQDRRVNTIINRTFNAVNANSRVHSSFPSPPPHRPVPPPVNTGWAFTPSLSPVIVRPTDDQIIEATQVLLFRELTQPINNTCPITQDTFQPNDIVIQISHCGHNFKPAALRRWFERNCHCPLCRFDIREHTVSSSNSSREQGNITPTSSPLRTVFTASNRDEAIQHLSEAVASDLASRMFSELSFSGTGTPLNISYSFLSSLSEHNNSGQGPQQNPPNSNEDVE